MSTTIKIRNLNQYYGKKQVLNDINLTIQTGMFGLLGRNGAGKTTLMKVIATLLPQTRPLKNLLFFRLKFQIHTKNPPVSIILVDFS